MRMNEIWVDVIMVGPWMYLSRRETTRFFTSLLPYGFLIGEGVHQ